MAQILAFVSPFIAVGSGALAAWLLVHVQVLGIFHVAGNNVSALIASGVTFAVTSALVWFSHHEHWLPLQVRKLSVLHGSGNVPLPVLTTSNVVAFLQPYISIAAGAVAAWLLVHVHLLGVLHLDQGTVAQNIASAVVFAVTAGITWAAHTFHWLPIRLVGHPGGY